MNIYLIEYFFLVILFSLFSFKIRMRNNVFGKKKIVLFYVSFLFLLFFLFLFQGNFSDFDSSMKRISVSLFTSILLLGFGHLIFLFLQWFQSSQINLYRYVSWFIFLYSMLIMIAFFLIIHFSDWS